MVYSPIGYLTMKKPRVNDFDPNATIALASPLDGMPQIRPAAPSSPATHSSPASADASPSTESHEVESTDQSIIQSIDRSINQSAFARPERVLEKPKAFYITVGLDKHIDQAVRYLKETHGIKKVDRSIVVTALLDNDVHWTEESLDLLVEPVVRHLTNRLTGK